MGKNEILQKLDDYVYSNISINFDSDGKVLTRSELRPKVNMIKNLILNFSIGILS